MMNKTSIDKAIDEANRFLDAAHKVRRMLSEGGDKDYRLTAAAKRASLDLSRALTELRKPT